MILKQTETFIKEKDFSAAKKNYKNILKLYRALDEKRKGKVYKKIKRLYSKLLKMKKPAALHTDIGKKALVLLLVVSSTLFLALLVKPETTGFVVKTQNKAPVLSDVTGITAHVGVPFSYRVRATDSEGHEIKYSTNTNLFALGVDGSVQWTPQEKDVGTHHIVVIATDEFNKIDFKVVTMYVIGEEKEEPVEEPKIEVIAEPEVAIVNLSINDTVNGTETNISINTSVADLNVTINQTDNITEPVQNET